ncbi:MAG: heme peroxidase [Actinomycetota bacterium]|nr:heme peroxidase [Actinomycetota bacterium]
MGYRDSAFWKAFDKAAQALDHRVGWHRLLRLVGLLVLVGVRNILRRENLYDTRTAPSVGEPAPAAYDARFETERTADGSYNDLADPAMGMAGSRFGRNVPIENTWAEKEPELLEPNPRTVSRALLTRDPFVPATTVNAIAGAWLQFMIRDWFSHGKSETANPWRIELAGDDPFPENPMEIMRTRRDPTRPADSGSDPATYVNTETHWWDGSSIYGVDLEAQRRVRTGEDGKLVVGVDGRLPVSPASEPTQEPGFWLGLLMLHTLFTLEHNAICDRLKAEYPRWSDEQLFQRARLVNAALLAKIHTMEWTPAVISHPTTVTALRANWFGLAEERVHKLFGRLSDSEVISGIPGSETNHYGVPYSLTEEFVAVYRMHPLISDDWSFRAAGDDRSIDDLRFRELTGPAAVELTERMEMTDLFYSFGTQHPGLVTLHNFPRDLQEFRRPDGRVMDLGAVDVLRIRELGVPRYCEFRRLLHLPVPETFEELTDDPGWAQELREVYGDVEKVDLMIGMYAEPKPAGFAFSDTAFRVFVLMASRRLNSDRFFTRDYGPRVYTQAGIDWIDDNQMSQVLLRHYPELRSALRGLDNAFEPWAKAAG